VAILRNLDTLPETEPWDRDALTRVMEDETTVVCLILFDTARRKRPSFALPGRLACSLSDGQSCQRPLPGAVVHSLSRVCGRILLTTTRAVTNRRRPVDLLSRSARVGWHRRRDDRTETGPEPTELEARPGTNDDVPGRRSGR
jgi:hypothetical protein